MKIVMSVMFVFWISGSFYAKYIGAGEVAVYSYMIIANIWLTGLYIKD